MDGSCYRPVPEARRGPPMSHPGASHSLKPEKTIGCPAPCSCSDCGACIPAGGGRAQPESKTFVTLDADGRAHAYQLKVGYAWCQRCRRWARSADALDARGACYAPALFAKLLILYSLAATDRKASQRLPALFGLAGCPLRRCPERTMPSPECSIRSRVPRDAAHVGGAGAL